MFCKVKDPSEIYLRFLLYLKRVDPNSPSHRDCHLLLEYGHPSAISLSLDETWLEIIEINVFIKSSWVRRVQTPISNITSVGRHVLRNRKRYISGCLPHKFKFKSLASALRTAYALGLALSVWSKSLSMVGDIRNTYAWYFYLALYVYSLFVPYQPGG